MTYLKQYNGVCIYQQSEEIIKFENANLTNYTYADIVSDFDKKKSDLFVAILHEGVIQIARVIYITIGEFSEIILKINNTNIEILKSDMESVDTKTMKLIFKILNFEDIKDTSSIVQNSIRGDDNNVW